MELQKKYCQSGEYCRKCRARKEGRGLRQAFVDRDLVPERDFECPLGKEWGWEPPSMVRAVARIASGAGKLAFGRLLPQVSAEEQGRRLDICQDCDANQPCVPGFPARCCGDLLSVFSEDGTCACLINAKSGLAGEQCPRGLWAIEAADLITNEDATL